MTGQDAEVEQAGRDDAGEASYLPLAAYVERWRYQHE